MKNPELKAFMSELKELANNLMAKGLKVRHFTDDKPDVPNNKKSILPQGKDNYQLICEDLETDEYSDKNNLGSRLRNYEKKEIMQQGLMDDYVRKTIAPYILPILRKTMDCNKGNECIEQFIKKTITGYQFNKKEMLKNEILPPFCIALGSFVIYEDMQKEFKPRSIDQILDDSCGVALTEISAKE